MVKRFLFAVLLPFCGVFAGCAGSYGSPTSPRIDDSEVRAIRAIGQKAVAEDGIVGVSIAVAIDGQIVFSGGFGHADAERSVAATSATIYDIASAGKQFTAVAVLELVERGTLSLDQRVRSLVPELPDHFPDATVEQLLRHTSGFVSGTLDELNPPADYTIPRYGTDLLTDVELQTGQALFAPEETWVYSNAGYLVLGLVIEAVSGMRYDEYIREEVLASLEPHTMFVCEYPPSEMASARLRRTSAGVEGVPYIDMSAWGGQGSINSNVVDLLRWSRALNGGQIIDSDSLEALRSPSVVRGEHAAVEIPYGMAQRIGSIGGYDKVGHTGTFDGGSAALAYYPNASLEIAVLSNTYGNGTPHAHTIETAIAKTLLGVADPDVRSQRVPLTESQRRAIAGAYTDGQVFEATTDGDELVVLHDGEEVERLIHIGDMRFRNPDSPDVFEWFLMDGSRGGWWVYSVSGNFLEVLRRTEP